ncbi:MAG: hypothetical protein ACOCTT_02420 [archaeon]
MDKEIVEWCKENLEIDPEELIEHIYEVVEKEREQRRQKGNGSKKRDEDDYFISK